MSLRKIRFGSLLTRDTAIPDEDSPKSETIVNIVKVAANGNAGDCNKKNSEINDNDIEAAEAAEAENPQKTCENGEVKGLLETSF